MKQPVTSGVIEFPLERTMENKYRVIAAFAIFLLAQLSLSSVLASENNPTHFDHDEITRIESREKRQGGYDTDIGDYGNSWGARETHSVHPEGKFHERRSIQGISREKRELNDEEFSKDTHPLHAEEKLPEIVHEKRTIEEEQASQMFEKEAEEEAIVSKREKNEAVETKEELNPQDDATSYKNMHDVIQALMLADNEDLAERLVQLREAENTTESETHNHPKRHLIPHSIVSMTDGILGADLGEVLSLEQLDSHSCESEAIGHGHVHHFGVLSHQLFCEMRKSFHYGRHTFRNLKSGFSLGPLITEDYDDSVGFFGNLCQHYPRIIQTVITEPHHLMIIPEIIRDAVPFTSLVGHFHRIKHAFFNLLHFMKEPLLGHFHHIFHNIIVHHPIGLHLRERLHSFRLHGLGFHRGLKMHYLQGLCPTVPLEGVFPDAMMQPIPPIAPIPPVAPILPIAPVSSAAASASASASSSASASAAAAASSSAASVPDYYNSLAEVLASFHSAYDGYHASGIPSLLRSGAFPSFTSYLSRIPSFMSSMRFPFLSRFMPVAQDTTVTSTATATSTSVGGGPVVEPIVEPVVESGVASASAAASASSSSSSTTTTVTESLPAVPMVPPQQIMPMFSVTPTVISAYSIPFNPVPMVQQPMAPIVPMEGVPAVSSSAAAAAASSAASASPAMVESDVVEQPMVDIDGPEVVDNSVATSSASAAASSSSSGVPDMIGGPRFPLMSRFRSGFVPGGAGASAASSASATSSGGPFLGPEQYRGLDLNIDGPPPVMQPRLYPTPGPMIPPPGPMIPSPILPLGPSLGSSAASAAAAASSSSSSAAASSSASSGGFSFELPREKLINAIGSDCLPGDIIAVTLRNKATLFGRVMDTVSPITFSFLRPKLHSSLLRNGRVWNLLPRDFRDPDCYRAFNDPMLLRGF